MRAGTVRADTVRADTVRTGTVITQILTLASHSSRITNHREERRVRLSVTQRAYRIHRARIYRLVYGNRSV